MCTDWQGLPGGDAAGAEQHIHSKREWCRARPEASSSVDCHGLNASGASCEGWRDPAEHGSIRAHPASQPQREVTPLQPANHVQSDHPLRCSLRRSRLRWPPRLLSRLAKPASRAAGGTGGATAGWRQGGDEAGKLRFGAALILRWQCWIVFKTLVLGTNVQVTREKSATSGAEERRAPQPLGGPTGGPAVQPCRICGFVNTSDVVGVPLCFFFLCRAPERKSMARVWVLLAALALLALSAAPAHAQ